MIRTMISHSGNTHSIAAMCQTLEVSRSGYYQHTHKAGRPRRQQDQVIALRWSRASSSAVRLMAARVCARCSKHKGSAWAAGALAV
jgi:ribosomal protein L32